jgi:hypothetical protein
MRPEAIPEDAAASGGLGVLLELAFVHWYSSPNFVTNG